MLMLLVCMTSCSDRLTPINKLRRLADDIRLKGPNYGMYDWERAKERYVRINNGLNKYEYTDEEWNEIGLLKGKCMGYFIRGVFESTEKKAKKGHAGQLEGILKGFNESLGDDYRENRKDKRIIKF